MKVNIGKLELVSGNLYTDSHKQMVYVDKKNKVGYIIPKKSVGLVRALCERLLVSILVCVFAWVKWHIIYGVIAFVVVYLIMYFALKNTLKKFNSGDVNDIPEVNRIEEETKTATKTGLFINGVMSIALVIALMVYVIFYSEFDIKTTEGLVSVVAVVGVATYFLYMGINYIKLGFKREK